MRGKVALRGLPSALAQCTVSCTASSTTDGAAPLASIDPSISNTAIPVVATARALQ